LAPTSEQIERRRREEDGDHNGVGSREELDKNPAAGREAPRASIS
jgi:hypothetical protein